MLGLVLVNDPYQSLRIRRFLTASAVYAGLIGLGGLYVAAGMMSPSDWFMDTAAIIVVNGMIYMALRSGRNEQLPDPSLTLIQMIAACLLTALMAFHVDGARGGLMLILMALLMFAAFRLRVVPFLLVGGFAVACFAVVTGFILRLRPMAIEPREALLELAALALAVPCGALFVSYVGSLRRQLRSRQLELQRANEAVHELSIQDGLTGIHNRAEIVRLVSEECERAKRLDTNLCVGIIDLDNFKAVNRRYDHTTGDEILKRVAALIDDGIRAVDAVGRYGGEEFLVVLPDTTLEDGCNSMEALRTRLAQRPLQNDTYSLDLTVSVGVAAYQSGDNTESLIERARSCADEVLNRGGDGVLAETQHLGND